MNPVDHLTSGLGRLHRFAAFRACEDKCEPVDAAAKQIETQRVSADGKSTVIEMDDGVQKSCWGITAKAVIGFAGVILLVWLVGGSETTAMLAAS